MDGLQHTLAATRLDQTNLGSLLKSWQVGQLLTARAHSESAKGQVLLQVAGQKMVAATDVPIQKGSVLLLQVTSLSPTPNLKIITAPNVVNGVPSNPIEGQLQLLLPQQGSVAAPWLTLLDPVKSVNLLSLLGLKNDELQALVKNLAPLSALTDPKRLQQALLNSGVFLEAELAQLTLSGGIANSGDLKAVLFQLLQRAGRALGKLRNEQMRLANGKLLLSLQEELQGALATLSLNQLAMSGSAERDGNRWVFDLPFMLGDSIYGLSLSISHEPGGSSNPAAATDDWKVWLSLNLPKLGSVEADLYIAGSKLSTVIYAQQQTTHELIAQQLPSLRENLEGHRLDVSVLRCHHGIRSAEDPNNQWSLSVDEKV